MPDQPISLIAGGDIEPARFVKQSTAADFTALQAGANEEVFGVSVDASQVAPTSSSATKAAASGDLFRIFGPGEECLLELGAGGATRGDKLKSDANGKGVTTGVYASATPQFVGAVALESGVAGEKIKVRVQTMVF